MSPVDDDLVLARRARMRWNAPLAEAHAELLLDRLNLNSCTKIVDLGCGWGELLMRAVERANASSGGTARVRGVGVDTDPVALERGRTSARDRGLAEQVEFIQAEATTWQGQTERALCTGSSHAFGGSRAALDALSAIVPPGGRVLFGDGCWPGATTPAALEIFGEDILPLAELVETTKEAGWQIIHMSVADQQEWDDFESTSRAGRQEWLLANSSDPRAEEVREWLDTREQQYMNDYRGILGFAYLIMTH